jgi:hypothetical protein
MELKTSKSNRRIGITINFICLILIVLIYELLKSGILIQKYLLLEIAPVALLIITDIMLFGKTKLWKFTHKPYDKLDEREKQLSNQSLRFSYSFFTIFSLALLYTYNLWGIKINIILIASLIYMAHTLPAYFISWTANKIIEEN